MSTEAVTAVLFSVALQEQVLRFYRAVNTTYECAVTATSTSESRVVSHLQTLLSGIFTSYVHQTTFKTLMSLTMRSRAFVYNTEYSITACSE